MEGLKDISLEFSGSNLYQNYEKYLKKALKQFTKTFTTRLDHTTSVIGLNTGQAYPMYVNFVEHTLVDPNYLKTTTQHTNMNNAAHLNTNLPSNTTQHTSSNGGMDSNEADSSMGTKDVTGLDATKHTNVSLNQEGMNLRTMDMMAVEWVICLLAAYKRLQWMTKI